jgi:hypothetical protein
MASSQSSSDDEVDFDEYRKEYESNDHWMLRKSFLIQHWDNFDSEDILLRNAQLFINIETLGCKYSNEIMHQIAELAAQVPEVVKYRELRKNNLKRTMVGAQASIKSKYKKEALKPKLPEFIKLPLEEEIEMPSKEDEKDWSTMEKAFWDMESRVKDNNFHLIRISEQQRLENRRSLLKDVILFEDLNGLFDYNKTSTCMSKIGKFQQSYDDKTGKYIYIFNGEIVAEGKGDSKKTAKRLADKAFEIILRGYCYQIRPKVAYFSPEDVIQRNNGNENGNKQTTEHPDKLKEDNLGFRMLQALGWKGGTSLGTKNEGIIDPINLSIKIGRKGLGNDNPSFDPKYFENMLRNFKKNEFEYDLVFSPDFSKEERAQIHQ